SLGLSGKSAPGTPRRTGRASGSRSGGWPCPVGLPMPCVHPPSKSSPRIVARDARRGAAGERPISRYLVRDTAPVFHFPSGGRCSATAANRRRGSSPSRSAHVSPVRRGGGEDVGKNEKKRKRTQRARWPVAWGRRPAALRGSPPASTIEAADLIVR